LIVPGKSFAMPSRTGHVWQPIGNPRGLAFISKAPVERSPAAAAAVFAALLINSLLRIAGIQISRFYFVLQIFVPLLFFAEKLDVLRTLL
jgi:hypothetical protein